MPTIVPLCVPMGGAEYRLWSINPFSACEMCRRYCRQEEASRLEQQSCATVLIFSFRTLHFSSSYFTLKKHSETWLLRPNSWWKIIRGLERNIYEEMGRIVNLFS